MKIFGIGFHKTGTSSLANALQHLGYSVTGPDLQLLDVIKRGDRASVFAYAEKFEAFQDNPWPLLYKELDNAFPNSKFILTTRANSKWLDSVLSHFGSSPTAMRKWIYGKAYPLGNENVYLEKYEKHNSEVRAYFKDRSEDLLELNIESGEGWKELCTFLDHEIPDLPFPHKNKREDLLRTLSVYERIKNFFKI